MVDGDAWRISLRYTNATAQISFLQIGGRGFDLEHNTSIASQGWISLTVPGNPPAITATNRSAAISHPADFGTNGFYRVRVFEP